MQDDDIVDIFQDRGDRIQQQDGSPFPEQGSLVKTGVKNMANVTRTSTIYFTSRKKRFADNIIPNAIVKRISEK
jgi:hypothetical protein